MKIEWLNRERTEAIVTRGWWRRKRRAHVERFEPEHSWEKRWRFVPSGNLAADIAYEVERQRALAIGRDKHDADWQPVCDLPVARAKRVQS